MPLIAEDSVKEILESVDLAELIRGRTNLTKRGGRWVGRCPFHDERTPSFGLIPPENRWYYCHGCGAKGTAIDWMMTKEGASSYPEALEALAERFGVEVRYAETSPEDEARRKAQARRLELLSRAAAFYREYLWRAPEAAVAREYLVGRGFSEELIREFDIGFAPASGRGLAERAARQGFRPQDLIEAGLGRPRGAGVTDFFVNRITFPIGDARGRVLGFGARTLDPTQRAKYVNSPEGPHFQKRRLLFGLNRARAAAVRAGDVMVVEGYTDVLAFAKAGIDQAVACMGTSLTEDQVRELKRVAQRICLCFDGDAAGQKAAWRSAEAASAHIMDLDALVLPEGADPGDLAGRADGVEALRRMSQERVLLVTSLIENRARQAGRSASSRDDALGDITRLLRVVPESVEKDEAVRLAAGLLGLSGHLTDHLRDQAAFSQSSSAGTTPRAPSTERPRSVAPVGQLGTEHLRERHLLAMAAAHPAEAASVLRELPESVLTEPEHRQAMTLLREGVAPEEWPESLHELALALRVEGAALHGDDSTPETRRAALREASLRVQLPALERRAAELRARGDEQGRLETLDLVRRLRLALRGAD